MEHQFMNTELVTLQLPTSLYEKLQTIAVAENTDVVGAIAQFVATANQKKSWLQDLTNLRQQIQAEGGLQLGTTKEEIAAKLHQTRQEIFVAEYAHLYR
jgi:hypothetical protein